MENNEKFCEVLESGQFMGGLNQYHGFFDG